MRCFTGDKAFARHKPCVYFVQHLTGGPIKIGTTTHLRNRLKEIYYPVYGSEELPQGMTYESREKRYVGIMLGNRKREAQIHKRFAIHRMRCEWFDAHSDILKFIAKWTVPYDPTESLPEFVKVTGKSVSAIVDPDVWQVLRDLAKKDQVPLCRKINEVLRSALLSGSVLDQKP